MGVGSLELGNWSWNVGIKVFLEVGILGEVRHFTALMVWRKAHALFFDILNDADGFPQKRAATILLDQIVRSCGSISANVAEGFHQSRKKCVYSLNIAIGETNETENWLYKLRDARFFDNDIAMNRLKRITEIRKMLLSLKRKIESNTKSIREPEPEYEYCNKEEQTKTLPTHNS